MRSQTLFNNLYKSKTPFHATKMIAQELLKHDFKKLDENDAWELKEGENYFVTRNESSIIAFTYPSLVQVLKGYTMVGAHTDSPTLKIKPNADRIKAGVRQLGVEPYGGVLLSPWFDRDLSIAGRVSIELENKELVHLLVDFEKPVAFIPSLAIHLDREVNDQRSINAQKHLPVVIGLEDTQRLEMLILKHTGVKGTLLSHELTFYDTQAPSFVGFDEELFSSARLDNLLSCFVGLEALVTSDKGKASLLVCNDHEEVGSRSSHGAQSNFLKSVLERIAQSSEDFTRMMQGSLLISTDNAHALHPNFPEVHEEQHAPLIGQGVVIKHNANQSYATNGISTALFKQHANRCGIKTQEYVVRSDMGCGSTIGPITAARLGINTIDIGLPTWAMHSIRESASIGDVQDLEKVLVSLFER